MPNHVRRLPQWLHHTQPPSSCASHTMRSADSPMHVIGVSQCSHSARDCMRAAAARLAALLALAVLLAVLLAALRPSPSAAWKCKGRGG